MTSTPKFIVADLAEVIRSTFSVPCSSVSFCVDENLLGGTFVADGTVVDDQFI